MLIASTLPDLSEVIIPQRTSEIGLVVYLGYNKGRGQFSQDFVGRYALGYSNPQDFNRWDEGGPQ